MITDQQIIELHVGGMSNYEIAARNYPVRRDSDEFCWSNWIDWVYHVLLVTSRYDGIPGTEPAKPFKLVRLGTEPENKKENFFGKILKNILKK